LNASSVYSSKDILDSRGNFRVGGAILIYEEGLLRVENFVYYNI